MSSMKKAPHQQGLSQPELILSLDTSLPTISRKKIPTTYRSKKPFVNWWEETLDNHWPLENPPDWELLTIDQKRTFKMAAIGYCLRRMEGSKK